MVNKLNADFVRTVRSTGGINATRALMIPTYAASMSTNALNAWVKPDDSNVILSVHAYTPYNFAMNGYTVFDSEMEGQLAAFFNDLNSIFVSNNIPVCIGEFSAGNYGNTNERVKWAESYASKAVSADIPIVLRDNNSITNSSNASEANGYLNFDTYEWYEASEPVVNKLVSVFGGTQTSFTPENDYDGETAISCTSYWGEKTITADQLKAGFSDESIESVTIFSRYRFTLMYDDVRYDNIYEYTLSRDDLRDVKVALSFDSSRERPVYWRVNRNIIKEKYNQFSATDQNGRYAQRHLILVKLTDLAPYTSVTMTYYDEASGKEVSVTTGNCSRSCPSSSRSISMCFSSGGLRVCLSSAGSACEAPTLAMRFCSELSGAHILEG